MGYLEATSNVANSHLYSEALQMKLYQAFIFSIPILFSIILFLLFYLFYLKRTFSTSTPPRTSTNQASSNLHYFNEIVLKVNLEDKLKLILFDEDLYAKDSMCCVCLGEFEIKEKLHQIPWCQHVFHVDCIRSWLHSNATCPLCRCSVVTTSHHDPPVVHNVAATTDHLDSTTPQGIDPLEHSVVIFEGSSSTSMDNNLSHLNEESVVVDIRSHES